MRVFALAAAMFALMQAAASAESIGVASSVRNDVRGALSSDVRSLGSGDGVFQNELISTGLDSATQLLFRDRTSVTMGESAQLSLNKFVYDPRSDDVSEVVLRAVKGAFRFISGIAQGRGYSVETPRATIGIRGSIVEGFIDLDTGHEVIVLVQGTATVCQFSTSSCVEMIEPGTFVQLTSTGKLIGPIGWRGPIMNLNAGVNFSRLVIDEALHGGNDPLSRSTEGNERLERFLLDQRFPANPGEEPFPEPEPEPGPELEP